MNELSAENREILEQISKCVQVGKSDAEANIPPGSKGQPGVAEWVTKAISADLPARTILEQGMMVGMGIIGKKFAVNEVFIPEVLIAARAMHAGLDKLKPLFDEQDAPVRGTFVIGTVEGDLHDIGKNLVCMLLEGAGWKIVDLGVDCKVDRFLAAIEQHPDCVIGMSALLTTTMVKMRDAVAAVHERSPDTVILIGGAPVTESFAQEIGATGYAPDPATAIDLLDRLKPAA